MGKDNDTPEQPQQERKKSTVKKLFSKFSKGSDTSSSSPPATSPSNSSSSQIDASHQSASLSNFVKESIPDDEEEINRRFMEAIVSLIMNRV